MSVTTVIITVRTTAPIVKSRECSSQKRLTVESIVPGTRNDRIRSGYGARLPRNTHQLSEVGVAIPVEADGPAIRLSH